ncbi:MAG: hypothetical protein H0W72_05365 [Planctomycetes bacterium]|nr:hypothetical protein [Planctomycetota bacterium]
MHFPILRARRAFADPHGGTFRLEAGQVLDWSDPVVQRFFRANLGWDAFAIEWAEPVEAEVASTDDAKDLAAAQASLQAEQADHAATRAQVASLEQELAKLAARLADLAEDAGDGADGEQPDAGDAQPTKPAASKPRARR